MTRFRVVSVLVLVFGTVAPVAAEDKARVVELFEDEAEPMIKQLVNESGEPGTATRDDAERFAGGCALKVTPLQRYTRQLKGWSYPIVEKPQAGEYRYIRFAWKKAGGTGIMLQLCAAKEQNDWGHRYVAGQQSVTWESLNIAAKAPEKWEVVTRDLFKDFGAFTLTGIAFTPMDGTAAYYDHIYLGRSVEDLDKVTDAVLGKTPVEDAPTADEREKLWEDLGQSDAYVTAPARRRLVADGKDTVVFLRERWKKDKPAEDEKRILKLIADLDDDDFEVREKASAELAKLGERADALLKKALAQTKSAEVKQRLEALLADRVDPGMTDEQRRFLRVIRVLEQIGTTDARSALEAMPKEKLAAEVQLEAKITLERWKTREGK